jgi:rubrerythrin
MTELEKLKHLLEHWIEHNDAHVKTYNEWALKAESLGEKELSDILRQAADESRKMEGLFKEALIYLQK